MLIVEAFRHLLIKRRTSANINISPLHKPHELHLICVLPHSIPKS